MFDSTQESSDFGHTHDADAPTFIDVLEGSTPEVAPQDSPRPTEHEPTPDSLSRRALIYGLTGIAAGAIVGEPLWTTIQKDSDRRAREAEEEAEATQQRHDHANRVREQQEKDERLIRNFHGLHSYFAHNALILLGDASQDTLIPLMNSSYLGVLEGKSAAFTVNATMEGLIPRKRLAPSKIVSFWEQKTSITIDAATDRPDSAWDYTVTTRMRCLGYSNPLMKTSDVEFRKENGYGTDYVELNTSGEFRGHNIDSTVTPEQLIALHAASDDNTVDWRSLQVMKSIGDRAFYRSEDILTAEAFVSYNVPGSRSGKPEYGVYDNTSGKKSARVGSDAYYSVSTKLVNGSNELLNLMQRRVGAASFEIVD